MADVVSLKTFASVTNEQAIAILRDYLAMAERGEIVAVAIAAIEPNGSSRVQSSSSDHFQGMLGALAILQYQMVSGSQNG